MQALWMLVAAFMFASMGVCVKIASADFSTAELVFYRGLVGMVLLAMLAQHQRVPLRTQYPGMHAWRGMVGVTSMGAWYYAIAHLPLPTAMTFNYMSSLWMSAFLVGAALWRWRPGGPRPSVPLALVGCVLVGFGGVVLLLRPSLQGHAPLASLVGLGAGVAAALAYLQVAALARQGEPETRTVFLFTTVCTLVGGAATVLTGWSPWPGWHALWLLPLGLFAAGGQMCMTLAYTRAPTTRGTLVVANLQYTGLIFAAIYGITVFGDELPLIAWVGMLLIVGSGIAATVLRARTGQETPQQER